MGAVSDDGGVGICRARLTRQIIRGVAAEQFEFVGKFELHARIVSELLF